MGGDAELKGVRRDEFYSVVGLLFLSLFAMVAVISLDPGRQFRSICDMILYTVFAGAGAWFMTLSMRERKQSGGSAPEATNH